MRKIKNRKSPIILLIALLILVFSAPLYGCNKPTNAGINHYEIHAVYDEVNNTVSASMELSYVNLADTTLDEVCMHLYPNAFRRDARFRAVSKENEFKVYPEGISYGHIDIKGVKLNGKDAKYEICGDDENILAVELDDELFPDERVKISVDFTLKIPTAKHRFGAIDGVVNLGNWYPIACVYDGGFVVEPYYEIGDPFYSDCADYEVEITVKKGLIAVGSSQAKKVENQNDDKYIFSGKNLRDFALCVGEFESKTTQYNGVKIGYYYPKNRGDERDESALGTIVDAVKTYEKLFGKYPYPSYSVARVNFYHGGMEYPAFAMVSSDLNQSLFTEALAHETAHQWWYGVVGNDQVKHAYLDEGLAEYSTTLFYENNPSYGVSVQKRLADATSSFVLFFEQDGNSQVIDRTLADFNSETEYAFCSYLKAQLMLMDLRKIVGDDKFFQSLKTYYAQNKFKIVTPDTIIGAFESVCRKSLKGYFDAWTSGRAQAFI